MTLTTFQKLLSELLAQYNEEAENHYIKQIELEPAHSAGGLIKSTPLYYIIEIKVESK